MHQILAHYGRFTCQTIPSSTVSAPADQGRFYLLPFFLLGLDCLAIWLAGLQWLHSQACARWSHHHGTELYRKCTLSCARAAQCTLTLTGREKHLWQKRPTGSSSVLKILPVSILFLRFKKADYIEKHNSQRGYTFFIQYRNYFFWSTKKNLKKINNAYNGNVRKKPELMVSDHMFSSC